MSGRQACVLHAPAERPKMERIDAPLDQRPGASDQPLHDGDEETGHRDRRKQKSEPDGHRGKHAAADQWQRRRIERGDRRQQHAHRYQETDRFAEVGDHIEGVKERLLVGDIAIDMYLTSLERAQRLFPRRDVRPKFTHSTLAYPDLIGRMKALDAVR